MKVNVNDKTEKYVFGKIIELRGNFKELVNEEGEKSYECDAYRTRNKTQTFVELDSQAKVSDAKQYLTDTDWIYAKCAEENLVTITEYPNIVAKRKESRLLIRSLE